LTKEHLQTVKKILRYIARTLEYGLQYGRHTGTAGLVGYYDSNLTGDIDTRKGWVPPTYYFSLANAW
jgi:hypothetical protein